MKRLLKLTLIGLCAGMVPAFAQGSATEKAAADSAKIFFEIAKSDIDLTIGNNKAQMEKVMESLARAVKEGKVEKISIQATASPDGSYEFNKNLSKARADAIVNYITERYPIPESKCESVSGGIAWDWLLDWAQKCDLEEKDEIIRILKEEPEITYSAKGKVIDNRKNCLRKLKCYNHLFNDIFPEMRSGAALYLFLFPVPEDQMPQYLAEQAAKAQAEKIAQQKVDQPVYTKDKAATEEVQVEEIAEAQAQQSPFFMGVKTNMLYDALAVPNIGVEFYLKDGWSISAMYHHAWWNTKSAHNWWRVMGGELEARKWIGSLAEEKPLQGHHIGVMVNLERYDFMFSGKTLGGEIPVPDRFLSDKAGYEFALPIGKTGRGRLSDLSYGASVSYGYSLPVAKRLNIDFEVALGFIGGKGYDYYIAEDMGQISSSNPVWNNMNRNAGLTNTKEWYYKTTEQPKYFWYLGPTKLGITLVYLIGASNYNLK